MGPARTSGGSKLRLTHPTNNEAQPAPIACSRSAIRSSGLSRPTESRSRSGGHGESGPLDAGAVLDQALDAAERGRPLPELHVGGGGDRRGLAALHAHRQHAAEAALHLPRGDGVAGMRREARIEHGRDARVPREVLRDRHGGGALVAHAHVQRAHAAQQQRRLERPQDARRAWRAARTARSQCASLRANTSAPATTSEWPFRYLVAECMTMSAPSAIGLREHRRRHRGIDRQQRAGRVGDARRLGDVGDGPERVGRRLDPDEPGLAGPHGRRGSRRDRRRRRRSPRCRGRAHPPAATCAGPST